MTWMLPYASVLPSPAERCWTSSPIQWSDTVACDLARAKLKQAHANRRKIAEATRPDRE
jgi:hypothetical protein